LGNSSVIYDSEAKLLLLMAGRALRGMLRTADYKGDIALKSCLSEFVHFYGAAFLKDGEISNKVSPFLMSVLYNRCIISCPI